MPCVKPSIISINISKGGIPKYAVASVRVTVRGLDGDEHNHEKHYRLDQAVCLQDAEILEKLTAEGYPLKPGQAGENLTVRGLNVNTLPLGTALKAGEVILEITRVRPTCYVMDMIHPQLKDDARGRHGMYAKVIKEGTIGVADAIEVVDFHSEVTR